MQLGKTAVPNRAIFSENFSSIHSVLSSPFEWNNKKKEDETNMPPYMNPNPSRGKHNLGTIRKYAFAKYKIFELVILGTGCPQGLHKRHSSSYLKLPGSLHGVGVPELDCALVIATGQHGLGVRIPTHTTDK